ncbi:Calmodulin [Lachnellula suecica]|uniref:Calmodulin n=1 Tax=Lachnellula suecica TaxID=602035 RepID=A0A8T9BXM9_9HELO|nr:Calmodulin [Lachnellula suecica]
MANYLSDEEIAIWKHEFDQYDADKGGNISVEEFAQAMAKSGQKSSEEEIAQMIKEVDIDGDGTINFDEFIAMMTGGRSRAPGAPPTAPAVDKADAIIDLACTSAWKEVDPTLEGKIRAEQFEKVMGVLGQPLSEGQAEDVMKGDSISYKEFVDFVKRRQVDDIVQGYGA